MASAVMELLEENSKLIDRIRELEAQPRIDWKRPKCKDPVKGEDPPDEGMVLLAGKYVLGGKGVYVGALINGKWSTREGERNIDCWAPWPKHPQEANCE